MAEILDDIDEKERKIELSDSEIFLQIWFSPKKVFTFIFENTYEKFLIPLLVLSGIVRSLSKAMEGNWGNEMPFWAVLLVVLIAGAFFGWISYFILAALISFTGKWIGGEGNTGSIMTMLAYASIPFIFSLALFLPLIIFFGNSIFKSGNFLSSYPSYFNHIFSAISIAGLVLNIWTFVLAVVGVAVAHKFSILKSILNFLLIALLFGALVIVIVLIMGVF